MPGVRARMTRHFGVVAPRYRELRDLDEHVVRRVSLALPGGRDARRRLAALDVGAGTGRYTEAVFHGASVRLGRRYHGVAYDAHREMLSDGAAYGARGSSGRIDRVIGLAEGLPFSSQSFDAVLSFNALHHFELGTFLAEAARVLQPGGRLILYTRTPDQNRRTVWGQLFPHFADRETRLYPQDTLRPALDATNDFESLELLAMPWKLTTSLPRLLDQARSSGYSTFQFYSRGEFEEALGTFEARVRARFNNLSAITAPNDHLLVLATRTDSPGIGPDMQGVGTRRHH